MKKISVLMTIFLCAYISCSSDSSSNKSDQLPDPLSFQQCDAAWGSDALGDSSTICAEGTVMVSAAMMLSVDKTDITPKILNNWLMTNGGYSGNLLLWNKIDEYSNMFCSGSFTYTGKDYDLSLSHLKTLLDNGNYLIFEKGTGNQWYLMFKYNNDGSSDSDFIYHDPGLGGGDLVYDSAALSPSQTAVYMYTR